MWSARHLRALSAAVWLYCSDERAMLCFEVQVLQKSKLPWAKPNLSGHGAAAKIATSAFHFSLIVIKLQVPGG